MAARKKSARKKKARNRSGTNFVDRLMDVARENVNDYVGYLDRVYDAGRDGPYKADDWSEHAAEFWSVARDSFDRVAGVMGTASLSGRIPQLIFVVDSSAEVADPQPIPLPANPDELEIKSNLTPVGKSAPVDDIILVEERESAIQISLINTRRLTPGKYDGLVYLDRPGQKRVLAQLSVIRLD
jgi:hypothetical protein